MSKIFKIQLKEIQFSQMKLLIIKTEILSNKSQSSL